MNTYSKPMQMNGGKPSIGSYTVMPPAPAQPQTLGKTPFKSRTCQDMPKPIKK